MGERDQHDGDEADHREDHEPETDHYGLDDVPHVGIISSICAPALPPAA